MTKRPGLATRLLLMCCAASACGDEPAFIERREKVPVLPIPAPLLSGASAVSIGGGQVVVSDPLDVSLWSIPPDGASWRFHQGVMGGFSLRAASAAYLFAVAPSLGFYRFPLTGSDHNPQPVPTPFDPRAASALHVAGTHVFLTLSSGLYRSTNQGNGWTQVVAGSPLTVLSAEANGEVFIRSMGLLQRSTDFGATFAPTDTGVGFDASSLSFVLKRRSGDYLFGGSRLYRWSGGMPELLALAPALGGLVELPNGTLIGSGAKGAERSSDGGTTWKTTELPISTSTTPLLLDGRVYLGSIFSSDEGATWQAPSGGTLGGSGQPLRLGIDGDSTIWVDTPSGVVVSQKKDARVWRLHRQGVLLGVQRMSWVLLNGSQSTDDGASWQPALKIPLGVTDAKTHSMGTFAAHPSQQSIYLGSWTEDIKSGIIDATALHHITPQGSTRITDDRVFSQVAVDQDGVLFAIATDAFPKVRRYIRSKDEGQTWTEVAYPAPLPFAFLGTGGILGRLGGNGYVAPFGTINGTDILYSPSRGSSWFRMVFLWETAELVKVDTVQIGPDDRAYLLADGAILRSVDPLQY